MLIGENDEVGSRPTLGNMRANGARTLAVVAFFGLVSSLGLAADLSGVPRIVDGDTLAIGSRKVRLEGIDAPETDQLCLNANGIRWTCGIDARDQLAAHIAGRDIDCSSHGTDAYRRTLATCYLAGEDLNGCKSAPYGGCLLNREGESDDKGKNSHPTSYVAGA
jgi:endonuclease YncB( thermonuclease family)